METKTELDEEAEAGGEAHRRAPRDSMFLQATGVLLDRGEMPAQFRVRNLSSGGMMADCDRDCAEGERVSVNIRNIGAVRGRVAWRAGARIGVAFEDMIDPRLARQPIATPKLQTTLTADLERMRRPGFRSLS